MRNRPLHLLHLLHRPEDHRREDGERRRAHELAHGDPLLVQLLLDAWRFGMNVDRYLTELVRPRNPAPYGRRVRRLGFADEVLYRYAPPPARCAPATDAAAAAAALPASHMSHVSHVSRGRDRESAAHASTREPVPRWRSPRRARGSRPLAR